MANVVIEQGVTVVAIDAEYDSLDEARLSELSTLLLSAAGSAQPPLLLLDLRHTKFIGSTFLGVVIRAWKRLRERNGRLALCSVNEVCGEILHASKLDTIWELFPDRLSAVRGLT